MFVSARRYVRAAESAVAVYRDQIWIGTNLRLNIVVDLADKTAVAHVLSIGTDGNNVIGRDDVLAGNTAQSDILETGSIINKCDKTNGCVAIPRSIRGEGSDAGGSISVPICVVEERESTRGRIVVSINVRIQRSKTA